MTNYLQIQNNHGIAGYFVTVAYEQTDNLQEVAAFETKRIASLLDRDIDIISEIRQWDHTRKISIKVEDLNISES